MDKKKFISDSIYGFLSALMPLIILQAFIFPFMAIRLTENTFGFVVTMVGVVTIIASSLGNGLFSVRLLLDTEYEKQQLSGDFNLLFYISCGIGFIASIILGVINNVLAVAGIILFSVIPPINIFTSYFGVKFRLDINYKKVFINSLSESAGYIAGIGLFIVTGYWQFIYILGFGFSVAYVMHKNPLVREPLRTTPLFKATCCKLGVMTIAALSGNTLVYIDRLILFPILGGEAVSIYYASAIVGKLVPMVIGPVAGVMLSHLVKASSIRRLTILKILLGVGAAGAAVYVFCMFVIPFALPFLYPSLAQAAMQYVHITTLTAIVNMLCIIVNPFVFRFRSINWQMALNGINIVVYLSLSLPLLGTYGLTGFCIGLLISTAIRLMMMVGICLYKPNEV